MALSIYLFLGLAWTGFVVVLVVHVAALFGTTLPFDLLLKFLGPGLFVVWLPTIVVMGRLTRDFKQKDIWRAALRGCPKWLARAQWILFGYTWIGFFALPVIYGGGMDLPANQAQSMSGMLLAFYSIAACVLYSAARVERFDESKRCPQGHRVSPLAKYCDECGAPVQTASSEPGQIRS